MEWGISIGELFVEFEGLAIAVGLFSVALGLIWNVFELRTQNNLRITDSHRDLWRPLISGVRLERISDPNPDLRARPITAEERAFVNFVFIHSNTIFRISQCWAYRKFRGADRDVRLFVSYPIPRTVWDEQKENFDAKFVRYVEANHPPR